MVNDRGLLQIINKSSRRRTFDFILMVEIAIKSGSDGGREVKYYDMDQDGLLDDLAGFDDTTLLCDEICARIQSLEHGAGGRAAHVDELREKFFEISGQRILITADGRVHQGNVLLTQPYSRTVLLHHEDGVEEISVPGFGEEEQLPN